LKIQADIFCFNFSHFLSFSNGKFKMKKKSFMFILLFVMATLSFAGEKVGVFEYVIIKCELDFEAASSVLETAINQSELDLVGVIDQTPPKECEFKTRVFAVSNSEYSTLLAHANSLTGPFAAVDRINLFEDENGLHVSIVNPRNILRTVLLDDEKFNNLATKRRDLLRSVILTALNGETSEKQYGQFRDKGYIGRTMGVMAGGPFDGKIKNVIELSETNLNLVASNLAANFDGKWKLHVEFQLVEEDLGFAVLGITSPSVESKSFSIVKAGSDKSRKDFECPGIAHAGAYPMEIVLARSDDKIVVRIVSSMYRMKMFFEDAGKFAFAKNMTMPGSIQDDIESAIKKLAEK
jgi:hypothetical protein